MKRWIGLAAGIAMVGACADQAPTSTERGGPSLSAQRPVAVFIWWLTSPVGTPLGLTDRHIDIRQQGIFVASPSNPSNPFSTHEEALSELLANPSDFYVNFHSDQFTGGFARGFLP